VGDDDHGYFSMNSPDYMKWPHWPNDKDVGFTKACVFETDDVNDDEYLNANKNSTSADDACINEY